jgi:hypothetical protein
MPYLKTIVDFVNGALKEELPASNALVIGIAQQLPRTNGEKIELLPSYVDNNGEAVYVGPDDDYDLIIYHKINSITVSKGNIKDSYGDDNLFDINVARIGMVVFGKRDVLKMSNDDLAIYLHAAMPVAASKQLLKDLTFRAANINVKDINLNDMQVFMEEFQNMPFFLKPEQFLFKINYTIESAFLKKCFKKGECNS